MDPRIFKELNKEEITPFHRALLQRCKQLAKMSRSGMSKYYNEWDLDACRYKATITPDKEDEAADKVKEPIKMCIPLAYSQVQTFISFCFSLFYQRRAFFECSGNNEQGQTSAKIAEALLDRDLHENVFTQKLYQFLLDLCRFRIGIMKHGWVKETQMMRVLQQIEPTTFLGIPIKSGGTQELVTRQTKFLGNRLWNISPYRFLPDTRLPLTRFQEGEFCGSEDEFTYASLKQREKEGLYAGVDFIPVMTKTTLEDRGVSRLSNFQVAQDLSVSIGKHVSTVIVTEMQIALVPKDFYIDGKPMGPEDYPVKYVVCYGNDQRIIRCEPMNYLHDKFTYDIALFSPDQHELLAEGLVNMISQLQDTVNWFVNSHIKSVRSCITNRFIVDPTGVNMEDFNANKPVIRLKPTAVRSGVDKWMKQLEVQDVTGRHIENAEQLFSFMQVTTGINDNMMGQYHSGRRSATEAKGTSMSSANRVLTIAKLVWDTALEPMGRKMISNLRDGLDEETYVKLLGQPDSVTGLNVYNGFVKADRKALMGEYDFEVFDGTLQSQKFVLAEDLKEILVEMFKNPVAIQMVRMDPSKIFYEMLRLRGIKNLERFMIQPQPQPGGQVPPNGQPTNQGLPAGSIPGTGPAVPASLPNQVGGFGDLIASTTPQSTPQPVG